MQNEMHSESENSNFQMYMFDAESPGQSLYTPTIVDVIFCKAYNETNFHTVKEVLIVNTIKSYKYYIVQVKYRTTKYTTPIKDGGGGT